jgi:RNA exonuclease 4
MGLGWSKFKRDAPSASLALWAEDNNIPAKDLAEAYGTSLKSTSIPDEKSTEDRINEGLSPTAEAGKYIAIDCEMVGVGPTPDNDSALARVSLVNYHGHQLYDSYVLPKEPVTDYRTYVSGITPELLQTARTLETVQADVARLLDGKILVGHAIKNDLAALLLGHSKRDIRDTSRHPPFRQLAGGKTPSLKRLARDVLGMDIQGGEHSSIEDARATMLLFRRDKDGFEREHMKKWGPDRRRLVKVADDEPENEKDEKKRKKKKKPKK